MFNLRLENEQLQVSYEETIGYGLVNSEIKKQYEYLQINEISNAFVIQDEESPWHYRIQVAHSGNYNVTVELEAQEESTFSLFLERRRCYVKNRAITKGEKIRMAFTCNVCPIIPDEKEERYEDTGLDITLLGENLNMTMIEVVEVKCPTIYMAGDSTSKDQAAHYPYNPFTSYCGWVQMLPLFLKEGIALSNHAHSGRTTESFREEGRWAIIKEQLQANDWVLIQFGHNDQKRPHLDPFGGYSQNLRAYIEEIRACEAYPVIITPVSRSLWNKPGLEFNDLLEDYAKACKQVGEELEVPVIDLHGRSKAFICNEGPIEAMKYFYPRDWTHFNDFGGEKIARLVMSEIQALELGLQNYLKERNMSFIEQEALENWHRPSIEEFAKMMGVWEMTNEWVKVIK